MTSGLPSLQARLVRRVILPLAIMWFAGTLVITGVSRYFTQKAFDRALLDDAYAVASHVRLDDKNRLSLGLSSNETETLLFDRDEVLFLAVFHPDGRLIAGHSRLFLPALDSLHPPVFTELNLQGQYLRAVVIARAGPAPFKVVIAQTTKSQDQLFRSLLLYSIGPQLLLLLGLALWLRRAIREDVQPLSSLAASLNDRDEHDLEPIPEAGGTLEIRRLGQAINALLLRISGIVQSQREFAGNVAHELRTPLAGIRALAEYGLAQDKPAVWREQLIAVLERQQHASHTIDQLLALALVVEAREVLQLKTMRLDQSVREALLRHLRRADALGVDLGVRGVDRPVEVIGQASLIDGILDNLIDNSLRYGKPTDLGFATITMGIDSEHDGSVVLTIVDNGPGINRKEWDRVTERWFKGSSPIALRIGTGLGLYLVAEYCRILKADLTLDSNSPDPGTSIRLRFPALPKAPSAGLEAH